MKIAPRWLDREAAAQYLSVRVDELPRLVKKGLIPKPSFHFGPRSPRWDREELDGLMGGPIASRSPSEPSPEEAAAMWDQALNGYGSPALR
nr:hypothetical protein [Roseomonas sp. SXEYE001]